MHWCVQDVLKEAEQYSSQVLVAHESDDFQVVERWEPVTDVDVQTPLEVYQELKGAPHPPPFPPLPYCPRPYIAPIALLCVMLCCILAPLGLCCSLKSRCGPWKLCIIQGATPPHVLPSKCNDAADMPSSCSALCLFPGQRVCPTSCHLISTNKILSAPIFICIQRPASVMPGSAALMQSTDKRSRRSQLHALRLASTSSAFTRGSALSRGGVRHRLPARARDR